MNKERRVSVFVCRYDGPPSWQMVVVAYDTDDARTILQAHGAWLERVDKKHGIAQTMRDVDIVELPMEHGTIFGNREEP